MPLIQMIVRYIFGLPIFFMPFLGSSAESKADVDFRALQFLAVPKTTGASPPVSPDQAEKDRRQQVTLFLRASEKAKEFYEENSNHPKAAEARKLEVESLLRAARHGATEVETKALRLAQDYRTSKANPAGNRFEVAVLAQELQMQGKYGGSREDFIAAYEKFALGLYADFPGEPRVFDLFLGIARTTNPVKARIVANQLLRMPAPMTVKDEAREIIARLDMVGKPLDVDWTDEQEKFHKLQDYKGRIVIFYVWATWAPLPSADQRIKKLSPGGEVLVSVNVDSDPAKGKVSRNSSGIGGIAYYDSRGLNSPLARQLRINKVPGVYVINAKSEFVGSGSPEMLDSLLEVARK